MDEKKKREQGWPVAIIGSLVMFMVFIGYLVFQAFQMDVNLVKKNYYQDELNYQKHIDDSKRETDVTLSYDQELKKIQIDFPNELKLSETTGEVYFYRPSNPKLDFKVNLELHQEHTKELDVAQLKTGYWKAQLSFHYQEKDFYKELIFNK